MENIEELQKQLICDMKKCIEAYSLTDVIDCLVSAIELTQEDLEDGSKMNVDLDVAKAFLSAVSSATEILDKEVETIDGCRHLRKLARFQLGNAIAAINLVKIG